jgi:hypothetical protein
VAIATQLADDDELAIALACRRLRQAVAGTERRESSARLSTRIGSAFCSVGKQEWAVVSWSMPLSGALLLRSAGRAARAAELAVRARLRVGAVQGRLQGYLLKRGCRRAYGRAAVGARGWLTVG